MALTRLGWDVFTSSSNPRLATSSWITGKVRGGDHKIVLDELARRYNAEVEKITQSWSWGWSYRAVRGATVISEHAAGCAVDFNAPKHGLGTAPSASFSAKQIAAIHKILSDLGGAVRWGGDYAGRKDPMHFELQGGNALVSKVAAKIKASGTAPAKVTTVAKTTSTTKAKAKAYPDVKATSKTRVASLKYLLGACGYTGNTAVRRQEWLHKLGYYNRAIDGKSGYWTILGEQQFLRKKGYYTKKYLLDGKFGNATKAAEIAYLNSQRKYL